MTLDEVIADLDALDQAELVRRREIKPIELVDAAIARIERLNPLLNAVITPMYDEARAVALGHLPVGTFTGVPFLLKDLVAAYRGVRLAAGTRMLHDFVPNYDSELVLRLKKAGLIILGKTNTPELGGHVTTEPALFGPTRNPWNLTRSTGGSSGGSAAAVAAGLVPMAHANDAAGSIRIPASCCGLFGLKPTRARNSLGPDFGDWCNGLAEEHAVTRTVRDSAALLDATAGPSLGDPYWPAPPERPFLQEVSAPNRKLRIAFTTRAPNGVPVHPDCVAATIDAANLCAESGHEMEEAMLPVNGEEFVDTFATVFACGVAGNIEALRKALYPPPSLDLLEPLNRFMFRKGSSYTLPAYLGALTTLQRMTREIAPFFTQYDAWLTPTLAAPPPPLGTFAVTESTPAERVYDRVFAFIPFTLICNATGQPGMTVPLYWNDENLPIGTHFTGRYGDEATLFRLAGQLERARGWAHRKAPVCV